MPDSDAYYDPQTGKWMIDDHGRPREATEEEIEAANPDYSDDDDE